MEYVVWWDAVHNVRLLVEDLARRFNRARVDYEYYSRLLKGLDREVGEDVEYDIANTERALARFRRRLMDIGEEATALIPIVDALIACGESIPQDKRLENHTHLITRLEEMKKTLEKITEYTKKLEE